MNITLNVYSVLDIEKPPLYLENTQKQGENILEMKCIINKIDNSVWGFKYTFVYVPDCSPGGHCRFQNFLCFLIW